MFDSASRRTKIAAVATGGIFLGGVLAASFLPVAPIWRQVMIGATLTGGQMAFIGVGAWLTRRPPAPAPDQPWRPAAGRRHIKSGPPRIYLN